MKEIITLFCSVSFWVQLAISFPYIGYFEHNIQSGY